MNSEEELNEFIDKFRSECIAYQENEMGQGLEQSFVQCAYNRTDFSEFGELIPIFIDGKVGNSRIKVEGFRYLDEDQTLILATSIFDFFKGEKKLTSTELITFANRVRTFFKLLSEDKDDKIVECLNIDFSTPEYDALDQIKNTTIERLSILIFTDYILGDRIKILPVDPVQNIPVRIELWDMKRLFEIENLNGAREPKIYSFEEYPIELNLASTGEGFKSYIGSMPAKVLAKMYKESGSRLLEGNVRSFLSSITSVNKQIKNSIKNNPQRFFILNNGIAVTARNLQFNEHGKLVEATDFQIINGGQTTATLSKAVYVDNIDVSLASVAVKITEIDNSIPQADAEQLVIDISRASNSQNKISDADFFSNHPFHIEMEKKSERLITPAIGTLAGTFWYYERSKGAYKQKTMFSTKSQQRMFESKYPKKQVVKKEDLARVWLCWKKEPEPNIVSKGAASLFNRFSKIIDEKWEKRASTGDYSDDYYKNTVSLIIILRDLKENIKKSTWYNGGYLANIATYTIALMAELIIAKYGKLEMFNLGIIWQEQKVPLDLLDTLLKLAENVTSSITKPDQGNANVTQWCKQAKCWSNLKDSFNSIEFIDNLSSRYILSSEILIEQKKKKRSEAKIDKDIQAQLDVCNYKYWKEAYRYDKENQILNGNLKKAIYDVGILNKITVAYDCKLALDALKKLREEGFRY